MKHAGSLEAAARGDGTAWASLVTGKYSNTLFFRYDNRKCFNASWQQIQLLKYKKLSLPAAYFTFAKTKVFQDLKWQKREEKAMHYKVTSWHLNQQCFFLSAIGKFYFSPSECAQPKAVCMQVVESLYVNYLSHWTENTLGVCIPFLNWSGGQERRPR